MSTQPDIRTESPRGVQDSATAGIPASRRLYWCVRRELWESRSIYLAPLAAAALILVGFLINLVRLPGRIRAASTLTQAQQHELTVTPYSFAALLIMGTTLLVAIFYCLDALHGERRDRSILFWKSLPVSDLMTVLSKAMIPIVVLPLLTFGITVVTQTVMLLMNSVVLLGSGLSVGTLWTQLAMFQMWLMLLFHLLALHGLWYAPIFGWLLMVSAWARRAPFLWAALPLVAIGVVEKIAFNTTHLGNLLGDRLGGGSDGDTFAAGSMVMTPLTEHTVAHVLLSPGLWIGLAVTAAFLAGAVRLRHYRGPI